MRIAAVVPQSFVALLYVFAVAACNGRPSGGEPDSGTDAGIGTNDAAVNDGAPADTGAVDAPDASVLDAPRVDAPVLDGSRPETTTSDGGIETSVSSDAAGDTGSAVDATRPPITSVGPWTQVITPTSEVIGVAADRVSYVVALRDGRFVERIAGGTAWMVRDEGLPPEQLATDVIEVNGVIVGSTGANVLLLQRGPASSYWLAATGTPSPTTGIFGELCAVGTTVYAIHYFGGIHSGIWRSRDGGASWSKLAGIPSHLGPDVLLRCSGSRLLIGHAMGVEVSNDEGASWDPEIKLPGVIRALAMSGDIAIASRQSGQTFLSVDGGLHWRDLGLGDTPVLRTPMMGYTAAFMRGSYILLAGPVAFMASTNGGESFAMENMEGLYVPPLVGLTDVRMFEETGGRFFVSAPFYIAEIR